MARPSAPSRAGLADDRNRSTGAPTPPRPNDSHRRHAPWTPRPTPAAQAHALVSEWPARGRAARAARQAQQAHSAPWEQMVLVSLLSPNGWSTVSSMAMVTAPAGWQVRQDSPTKRPRAPTDARSEPDPARLG